MKTPSSLRLAFARGLLGSTLLVSPLLALTPAELESLRAKAERGNSVAQYNLGLAYADNRQSHFDPAEAYAWLSLASVNGTKSKALADLAARLSPEQLAEGQRRFARLNTGPISSVAAASPIMAADEPPAPVIPVAATPAAPSAPAPAPAPVAEADADQKKLSAELTAAWKENELLKAGLTAQLADANKRVAIAEAALASKDREIAALREKLSTPPPAPAPASAVESPETAALRVERDELKAAAEKAARELATARAISNQLGNEHEALREKLARAVTEASDARRALALAEAETASLKAAADRAAAERLAVAAQLETATTELAGLKAANTKAAESGLSDTGVAVLKAERDRLAEAVKTLEQERDALAVRVKDQAVAVASTPAAPAAPSEDTSAQLAALQKAKAETDSKLEAALRSFTLQQTEIERLQKSLASIDAERASLAARLESANNELAAARPQADASAKNAAEAESLRGQLAATRQELSEKTTALADARKTVDTATTELVSTRDQLRQTQAQAAASANEIQQLKTRLALVGNAPAATSPARPGSLAATTIELPAATATAPTAAPIANPANRVHTVVAGDSLSRISKQYYGTANRWNDILQANKDVIRNPDALTLGTKLRIP